VESSGVIDKGTEDEGGKRKEGEELKASGPMASPVLAPPPKKIGSRTATAIQISDADGRGYCRGLSASPAQRTDVTPCNVRESLLLGRSTFLQRCQCLLVSLQPVLVPACARPAGDWAMFGCSAATRESETQSADGGWLWRELYVPEDPTPCCLVV
jgi:hypothetical protein